MEREGISIKGVGRKGRGGGKREGKENGKGGVISFVKCWLYY